MSDNTDTSSNSSTSDEQATFALARKVQPWLEIMSHPVAPLVFYPLVQSSIATLGAFCLRTRSDQNSYYYRSQIRWVTTYELNCVLR